MAKITLTKEQIQQLAETEDEQVELDPAEYLPDGYDVYSRKRVERMDERVNGAYENAKEAILSGELDDFDDYIERLKETHGLRTSDEEPDAKLRAQKKQLEERLEGLQSDLQKRRRRERDQAIIEGIREAGGEVPGDRERFLRMYRDDFQYDEEADTWVPTIDGEPVIDPQDGNRYAGAETFFSRLKEQGEAEYLFPDTRNKASGFKPAQDGQRGVQRISRDEYQRLANSRRSSDRQRFQKLRDRRMDGELVFEDE